MFKGCKGDEEELVHSPSRASLCDPPHLMITPTGFLENSDGVDGKFRVKWPSKQHPVILCDRPQEVGGDSTRLGPIANYVTSILLQPCYRHGTCPRCQYYDQLHSNVSATTALD